MLRARCAAPLWIALALACREPAHDAPAVAAPSASSAQPAMSAPAGESIFLAIGGETFTLELALDPATRQLGLGGRASVPHNGGMLFAFRTPRPLAMVMRDCPIPIDVAFLDAQGVVVAVHAMPPEPPRGPGESAYAYERRLPDYPSGAPAQFAIELAGGRLAQLGIGVGAQLIFDAPALIQRAR